MVYTSYYNSPLGEILLVAEDEVLTGLWFVGQKDYPAEHLNARDTGTDCPAIKSASMWLDKYFAGERPDTSGLKLAPKGSEFRQMVWDILCSIPYGHSMSYGQIAKQLEAELHRPMSAQAVGGAVGHNPISIIIPCHRVLGADGSLTGYAGGLDRKIKLLELEGIKTRQS